MTACPRPAGLLQRRRQPLLVGGVLVAPIQPPAARSQDVGERHPRPAAQDAARIQQEHAVERGELVREVPHQRALAEPAPAGKKDETPAFVDRGEKLREHVPARGVHVEETRVWAALEGIHDQPEILRRHRRHPPKTVRTRLRSQIHRPYNRISLARYPAMPIAATNSPASRWHSCRSDAPPAGAVRTRPPPARTVDGCAAGPTPLPRIVIPSSSKCGKAVANDPRT